MDYSAGVETSNCDCPSFQSFKNRIKNIDVQTGDKITIEGEIEEYNGNLELIVNKIKK